MTRDIIEINGFIVLIEYASSDTKEVEICGFAEDVVGIAFYGSGEVEMNIRCGDQVSTYQNTKGVALSFFASKGSTFEHTISPNNPMQSICIVSTLGNLEKLPQHEQEFFQTYLKSLVNPNAEIVGGPGFYMNHDMQNAVSKIYSSTYTENMRQMFLRSQVTELLAHFFAQVSLPERPTLNDEDRLKIHQANEIMLENIASPPSLAELSRQIGLNSNKLKKNFKEVFGMPVFKHLQNERLIRAHALLKEANLGIQEVAWQVGYESISSFSNAFMKKFGFRPSEIKT
ncbi:transcriptional regulator [Roseivirga sp. 4D4]|uniref:helix-turn-helix domain-containing protein n=1 Tax=Roseivirga sp. 4D4 TaxID=1889784 RepID=UPI000852A22D|nr:AraC family transcriptional regulator [Roseivirga sp. 4D4]OEK00390.1 transcriptional regulator [Roseivirga sp. 4D4]